MLKHSNKRTAIAFSVVAGCCCVVSGCSLLAFGAVALGESRRANSPEVVASREAERREKLARLEAIKRQADLGDAYAAVEVAKNCFDTLYPCMVPEPEEVFRRYSELGYDIATYYHASMQLGLSVWGNKVDECKRTMWGKCKFVDVKAGTQAMAQLARKGCEYDVQAFGGLRRIVPCSRLETARK